MVKLRNLPGGTIFEFNNIQWRLLNPTTGMSMTVSSVASRLFYNGSTSIPFSPTDTLSVAYYLNNTFYNTFPDREKALIKNTRFYTGYRSSETSTNVTCKVGLLRYSEWETYLSQTGSYPTSLPGGNWFITSFSAAELDKMYSVSGYNVTSSYANSGNKNVLPVIYMDSATTEVVDGKVVFNQAPTITPATTPSGTYPTKPSFNYTVADADGNAMTITEKIDGIVFNTRTSVASGTTLTYTPSDAAWLRTRIKQTVNIEITANDGNGGVTTVTYPITRTATAIDFALKTPFETDAAAGRLLLQLEGSIPNDAIVSVQACNNAFDASPTWENATNLVLSGFPYPFTNTTKTATKWGVSFKIRVERGSSTQQIYIDGVGGAFD